MNLKEKGWDSADWIHLAGEQGPLAAFCEGSTTIWIP